MNAAENQIISCSFHNWECIFIGKYFFIMLLQTPGADIQMQIRPIFFNCKLISKADFSPPIKVLGDSVSGSLGMLTGAHL